MTDLIESLELRKIFSATLSATGLLSITGTNGNDSISMPAKSILEIQKNGDLVPTPVITVMMNGVSQGQFNLAKFNRVEVRLLDGNDYFFPGLTNGRKFRVTVAGGEGDDTVAGTNRPDRLDGGPGDDLIKGNKGSDVLISSAGSDTIEGGLGEDTGNFAGRANALSLTEDGVANDGETGETGNLGSDVELILGGGGSDLISVKNITFGRYIEGRGGKNTILGGTGDDILIGGKKNDLIRGSAGDDQIDGGNGKDKLFGDSGSDVVVSRGDNLRDTVYSIGVEDIVLDDFMDILHSAF